MNRALKTERFKRHIRELDELETERAALISHLAAMDIRIATKREEVAEDAPMAMLPDDIGVEILRVAYQHDFPYCRGDSGRVADSPVAISQVNRWWRRLALSLPRIWACIHLTVDQPDSVKFAEMTKLYLERSKDLPVSIYCCCYTDDLKSHPQYDVEWDRFLPVWPRYQQAWRMLMAHKERWRDCAIYAMHHQFLDNLVECLTDEDFPRLEYFGMFLGGENSYDMADLKFRAPGLRHFRSYSIDWLNPQQNMPILCSSLTEVILSEMLVFPQHLWEFLQTIGSTVKRLMLSGIYSHNPHEGFDGRERVLFPKLQTLCLSDVDDIAWPILSAAPALDTLHISSKCDLLRHILEGEATMPTIRHLEIRSYDDRALSHPADDLENIPLAFPNVETLVLDGWDMARMLLKVIMVRMGGPGGKAVAFPGLRKVVVGEDNEKALQKLVDVRVLIGCPLREYAVLVPRYRSTPEGATAPIPRIPTSFDIPYGIWDGSVDRPFIAPWGGEWNAYDQSPVNGLGSGVVGIIEEVELGRH